jgi:hypothetical protein
MAWSHGYRARPEGWHAGADGPWVSGSHDGYDRGPDGVRHRRTVWLRQDGCVAILDEFEGTGSHEIEVNFQFAPGELADLGGAVRFNGVAELAWTGDDQWTPALACGGDHPASGWIAPSLGVRVAAPRLTLRHAMRTPKVRLFTVLAQRNAAARLAAERPALESMVASSVTNGPHA